MDRKSETDIIKNISFLKKLEAQLRQDQASNELRFLSDETTNVNLESGQGLDATINFEQQLKNFNDLQSRTKKGLENELRPLKQRVILLENKIKKNATIVAKANAADVY